MNRHPSRWWVPVLAALAVAGCSTGPAAPPPDVALSAPAPEVTRPVDGAALAPATTYRFADVLPGVLDVDLTPAAPGLFPQFGPLFAFLSGDEQFSSNVLTVVSAREMVLNAKPLHPAPSGPDLDPATQFVRLGADEALTRLAGQPFLEITVPQRPLTIAGVPATAIDVRVPELPAETEPCAPGDPPCADLLVEPEFVQTVAAGEQLRLAQLELPVGRVIVVQNLQDPRAQTILDSARFHEQPLPQDFAGARRLPYYTGELDAEQAYGAVLAGTGVGVMTTTGAAPTVGYANSGLALLSADLPPELTQVATYGGHVASTERLFGYVAPTADLLVPEPGVDPRVLGPTAFSRSHGADAGGLVEVVAGQPWAEVVAGPSDTTVGGLPGRSVDVRVRPGSGSVPCTIGTPQARSCAVLVYSRTAPSIWLLSERVLRVVDVMVAGQPITVIASTDDPGRAFADSLRLVPPTR
jgi:hypothetical protein